MQIRFVTASILCFAITVGAPGASRAYDVTSEANRRLTLLEYIEQRDDLSGRQKADWDKAIRLQFGGKALKDGLDEGVTVAKSVIAGAIFFGIPPTKGAKGAYDAYHDTYRWVPPPIAINYQILTFQGRKPSATARMLAFDFPDYFNEEMAPEVVAWWQDMLNSGDVADWEATEIRDLLRQTRALMRPMMRDRLWFGAQLEARKQTARGGAATDVNKALADLRQELKASFGQVATSRAAYSGDLYSRYRALSQELGLKPKKRPTPPRAASPKPGQKAVAKAPPAPVAKPAVEKPKPKPKVKPKSRPKVFAKHQPKKAEPKPKVQRVPAPLAGDPHVASYSGYKKTLDKVVDGWVGVPYLWGGITKAGVDCSGFSRAAYRSAFSIELPRNSRAQYQTGTKVQQKQLKPGDLVFFDTLDRGRVTHVGVYVGDGLFAHASSSKGVTRAKLGKKYYQRAYWGARQLLQR